jgi:hypothetical protein
MDDQDEQKDQNAIVKWIEGAASGLAHFDWLKIPGAVRAIAHVVTSGGDAVAATIDIGTAMAQQKAGSIRAETAAQVAALGALGRAAAKHIKVSEDLGQRATEAWFGERLRIQSNRERVARIAIEDLSATTSSTTASPGNSGPDEDWLNVFAQHAGNASSERMQETLAAILAGEIRSPGAFSLRTLAAVSTMDKRLADAFIRAVGWLFFPDFVPLLGPTSRSPKYDDLLLLAEAGIVTIGSSKFYDLKPGTHNFVLGTSKLTLLVATPQAKTIAIPAAILTVVGNELLNVIERNDDEAVLRELGAAVATSNGLVGQVIAPGDQVTAPLSGLLSELLRLATKEV